MSTTNTSAMMAAALIEIEAALPLTIWTATVIPNAPPEHDAQAFDGTTPALDWRFTVTSFDVAYQGFPEGTRGYDGAAVSMTKGMVVRLTRELAERAFKLASDQAK